jgi:hypothetical protein
MKLTKVSEKEIKTGAPVVLGVIGGSMLGRGVIAIATKPKDEKAITQSDKNKKMYVQLALLVAGSYGYMAVAGADTGSLVVKNVSLGIALSSALALVDDHSKNSDTIKAKLVADTQTNRFLKATIGLGCPCDSVNPVSYAPVMQLNRPKHRRHNGMGNPYEVSNYHSELPTQNFLELAYQKAI